MTKHVNVSYHDIKDACLDLAIQIGIETRTKNSRVEMIIGLSRGGLPIAVELSHLLDAPLTPVCYSAKSGHGDNKNHLNNLPQLPHYEINPKFNTPTIVIVDDIADSGHTLNEVSGHYFGKGYSVQTAVLHWKPTSVHMPTYHWKEVTEEDVWLVYPWENPVINIIKEFK